MPESIVVQFEIFKFYHIIKRAQSKWCDLISAQIKFSQFLQTFVNQKTHFGVFLLSKSSNVSSAVDYICSNLQASIVSGIIRSRSPAKVLARTDVRLFPAILSVFSFPHEKKEVLGNETIKLSLRSSVRKQWYFRRVAEIIFTNLFVRTYSINTFKYESKHTRIFTQDTKQRRVRFCQPLFPAHMRIKCL